MKNKIEFKKTMLLSCIVIIVVSAIFQFYLLYQYKVYTGNFNKKIGMIVTNVQNQYPNIDKNELIQILNNQENVETGLLKQYGINLENDSIIIQNDKMFVKFSIINLCFIIGLAMAVLLIFVKYTNSKDKKLGEITKYIEEINNKFKITVGAGVKLGELAQKLANKEISGFEFASGIPGTIGGAIRMNAGAHGSEMKDIVKTVTYIDRNGEIHKINNEQAKFEYRNSMFANNEYIIVETELELNKGNKEEIQAKMQEYANFRKEKQPIEYPSAGSTFKRGTDFITAKLIDECGLKGYQIGGAQVSEKHAGFIINKGNATSKDVEELIKYIKQKVYEKFGKEIETEIEIIH